MNGKVVIVTQGNSSMLSPNGDRDIDMKMMRQDMLDTDSRPLAHVIKGWAKRRIANRQK
jgi:hypothetical protein